VDIQSPIDGVVTSLNVSQGDYLAPGQELATVATVDKLRVEFGAKAADVGSVMPGAAVTVYSEIATQAVKGDSAIGRSISRPCHADIPDRDCL